MYQSEARVRHRTVYLYKNGCTSVCVFTYGCRGGAGRSLPVAGRHVMGDVVGR